MPLDIPMILGIMDLVLGVSVAVDGLVCVIWTFDTTFNLGLLILGIYLMLFGTVISVLSMKPVERLYTQAPFLAKSGGKLFAYTFLLGLSFILLDASWFAVLLMIFILIVTLAYLPLTFIPSMQEYKAKPILGGEVPGQSADGKAEMGQANPVHGSAPAAGGPPPATSTQL